MVQKERVSVSLVFNICMLSPHVRGSLKNSFYQSGGTPDLSTIVSSHVSYLIDFNNILLRGWPLP